MEIKKNEGSDPANASNDDYVFGAVRKGRAASSVELHAIGRRLTARQAVKIEVTLVIVGSAEKFAFFQSLLKKTRGRINERCLFKI